MEKKLCPIKAALILANPKPEIVKSRETTGDTLCTEGKCQWWVTASANCAIVLLATKSK